eukprot:352499-Chlamydomonas_euryale.AAC.3
MDGRMDVRRSGISEMLDDTQRRHTSLSKESLGDLRGRAEPPTLPNLPRAPPHFPFPRAACRVQPPRACPAVRQHTRV